MADADRVAGQVGDDDRSVGTGSPVLGGGDVVAHAAGRNRSVFVEPRGERGAVGGVERHREAAAVGDLDAGAGQRIGHAVAAQRQFADVNVVGRARALRQIAAGHRQDSRRRVVGRAADRRDGDVGGGQRVVGLAAVAAGDGAVPVVGRGQAEGRPAGRTAAVAVDDQAERGAVGGVERHRETRRASRSDVGRSQRVARAALAGQREFGDGDGVTGDQVGGGDREHAGGGIVARRTDADRGESRDDVA